MILHTNNHTYKYESEKICRIYFPAEKIIFACDNEELPFDSKTVVTEIQEEAGTLIFSCKAQIDGKSEEYSFSYEKDEKDNESLRERLLAKAVTKVLTAITGIVPPWGLLTGVRPAKLMRKYINTDGEVKAKEIFISFFEVTPEKTELAFEVANYENTCIRMSGKNSFSLYISIPFCPTRCSYCSFVSHSIDKAKKLIPDYINNLCREIEETARIAKELSLSLETVYIGGGTPTSFSAQALKIITSALNESFDMKNVREFTVEAGRPDTIDEEKLSVLKEAGVSRISINPQTFSDSVLEAIGRKHTGKDTEEKYFLARKLGFNNINMDFIAGLPTDSFEGFKKSLDRAVELSPENITVHTLALKRSASIVTENGTDDICTETERMVEYANKVLSENGYHPYYMYRQSKSVGNLENVGWCKKDKPCLYNIYMMEEIHTVLAVGGAAVTKLKDPDSDSLQRVYNFKYPYEYITRFSEIIERKDEIRRFYQGT
ncbi:MAG: coproporphyrinogen dehydrogenase HemZ [Clostridia bacterium]|nr:coproporphyrinogen dehydrogenase HemZ [Clostridia bacterium]